MEDFKVDIISRHLIKPSTPTPEHLKTVKLSLFDQLAPPCYIPIIFFYSQNPLTGTNDQHAQLCRSLMDSLSKALALFYPLAGKLDQHNFIINCDDSGVEFVEARVQARLDDVLQDRMGQWKMLLPVHVLRGIYVGEGTSFMVQVNSFECGGVAVAACISHQVADAQCFVEFMNAWAAVSRGDQTLEFKKEFSIMARHFPTWGMFNCNRNADHCFGNVKAITGKILCFDKEKLSSLKKAAQSRIVNNPTRVESVSAFIWKHFMDKQSNEELGVPENKTIGFIHSVNIRSRADPSLQLQEAFGNAVIMAPTFASKGIWQMSELAEKLRTRIRNVDIEYIKEMESQLVRDLAELNEKAMLAKKGEAELHTCTSWCGFPVYDVNFGWGMPVKVSPAMLTLATNMILLISSKTGEEIEAWLNYPPEDLESLEREFNLIGTMN